MYLTVEPTPATLGAVVTGIDLTALDAAQWSTLRAAFLEHAVLIFPGQHLSAAAQTAFAERSAKSSTWLRTARSCRSAIAAPTARCSSDHEHGMQVMMGNEGWHTDSSYMRLSAKASVLSAHVVPAHGGETEWADMRAAYDALDDAMRARIAGLSAYHSLRYSQARIGHVAAVGSSYGFHDGQPPLRPLVKVHPETGRPALYIGRHAYGIPGSRSGRIGGAARRPGRVRVPAAARIHAHLDAGRRGDLGQPLCITPRATVRPSRSTRDDARARGRRTRDRTRGELTARHRRGDDPSDAAARTYADDTVESR